MPGRPRATARGRSRAAHLNYNRRVGWCAGCRRECRTRRRTTSGSRRSRPATSHGCASRNGAASSASAAGPPRPRSRATSGSSSPCRSSRRIVIDRAPDGAPAPSFDDRPVEVYITMTDRADQAVCLVGPPGTAPRLRPRARRAAQRRLRRRLPHAGRAGARPPAPSGEARALLANLVWCGKESALKVLRTGLRRDTRSVEVSFPAGAAVDGWAPMTVRSREGAVFPGWWQRFGRVRAHGRGDAAVRATAVARRPAGAGERCARRVVARSVATVLTRGWRPAGSGESRTDRARLSPVRRRERSRRPPLRPCSGRTPWRGRAPRRPRPGWRASRRSASARSRRRRC